MKKFVSVNLQIFYAKASNEKKYGILFYRADFNYQKKQHIQTYN